MSVCSECVSEISICIYKTMLADDQSYISGYKITFVTIGVYKKVFLSILKVELGKNWSY